MEVLSSVRIRVINDMTAKTFGGKYKSKNWKTSTFMVLVWCPLTGTDMHAAVTSGYATKQQIAHVKAKKHTHASSFTHTTLHACTQTQRNRFTISAHFFWEKQQTKTQTDYSQFQDKVEIKKRWNHSFQHPQWFPRWVRTQMFTIKTNMLATEWNVESREAKTPKKHTGIYLKKSDWGLNVDKPPTVYQLEVKTNCWTNRE